MIKTWIHRCEEHPDHQTGMVSHGMIQARMQEEIDELRAALAQPEPEPVGWLYESRGGVRVFHPASDDKRFQADWEAAQQHPEAHKMTPLYTQSPQHLQSFAQDWDAPGMEAYDDPPLAQPEHEPVAWWDGKESVVFTHDEIYTPNWTDYWTRPLYTHPPQRKPLTVDQISEIDCYDHLKFARRIEKAHGIGGEHD